MPVFYYHGWPSSRLQGRLAHHLARDHGIRLIAMDRPGVGRSTFVADRTLDSWPLLMERFADSLEIGRFGQLAVSGGGPYALACAATIPERILGSAVLAGAVLLSELPEQRRGLHPAYRMMIPLRKAVPVFLFSGVFGSAALASRWQPSWPPLSWLLKSVAAEDRRLLVEYPDLWKVLTRSYQEGVGRGNGRGILADAEIYFQKPGFDPLSVTSPIRYWHGGSDRNIPVSMVRAFTSRIPGAELIVDEDSGHFSLAMLRAPSAFEYLATVDGKSGD